MSNASHPRPYARGLTAAAVLAHHNRAQGDSGYVSSTSPRKGSPLVPVSGGGGGGGGIDEEDEEEEDPNPRSRSRPTVPTRGAPIDPATMPPAAHTSSPDSDDDDDDGGDEAHYLDVHSRESSGEVYEPPVPSTTTHPKHPRKPKPPLDDDGILLDDHELIELLDPTSSAHKHRGGSTPAAARKGPKRAKKVFKGINLPAFTAPKSAYDRFLDGGEGEKSVVYKERVVLREFMDMDAAAEEAADASPPASQSQSQSQLPDATIEDEEENLARRQNTRTTSRKKKKEEEANSFTTYRLENFTFYHPSYDKRMPLEMTALHNLSVKMGKNVMLFDGILVNGNVTRPVVGVPCERLSIGNYEDTSAHNVDGAIWVQSHASKGAGDAWYELGHPAPEYERYHTPFMWLANFAKYYVDYLVEHEGVELADFKEKFCKWMEGLHGEDARFRLWREEYGSGNRDFRQAVAVYYPFLWNQVYGVSGGSKAGRRLVGHPVWDEVMRLEAIKPAPGKLVDETIVTPLVYDCFHHIFGDKLKAIAPQVPQRQRSPSVRLVHDKVEVLSPSRVRRDEFGRVTETGKVTNVKPGDVVAVIKDEVSNWKGKSEYWYAYVQHVNKWPRGADTLDVIWLYLPEDTILGQMRYPYANELFFSDNCNCTDTKLRMDEVVFKVSAALFCGPEESGAEFFLRQKFSDAESTFTTLKQADLSCECRKPMVSAYDLAKKAYDVGDTVLVESDGDDSRDLLEPAQIVRFDEESQCVELRQLFRRNRDFEDDPNVKPNELVYTEYLVLVPPQYISRRCHIRFVPPGGKPIVPYDRGGAGDCFFIMKRRLDDGSLVPAHPPPEGFNEGFDPDSPPEGLTQLRGMDLFCGGGNFGRGIEEGGAVVNRWAVDFDVPALHTYRANLRGDPEETQLYLGSVNNYLRDGLLGRFSKVVPPPGQVDFISAGSPCQGFSQANGDRDSERSLQNSSLVASVASFVDFYRPKFALLENVHGLAQDRIKKKDGLPYNVFSQLLCSLVAIGYQCQQFTLDAWSFGSCQTRTRLFVSIASPGQLLPPRPGRSHEHPSTVRSKSLFEAPNGKKFGGRELHGPCTFPFVSTEEVLGSLPSLGDNHHGICIPFPDHRHSRIEARNTRLLMTHIPRSQDCSSLRRAINAGRVPPSLDFYNPTKVRLREFSRSWSRISGEELCRTITTTITPQCSFTGKWMHYEEHRLLTVMEVRRVQSFPDEEVLLGGAVKTFKIVGNSVDRMVALAWGCSIREAWWGKGGAGRRRMEESVAVQDIKGTWTKGFDAWVKSYAEVEADGRVRKGGEIWGEDDEIEDYGDDHVGGRGVNGADQREHFSPVIVPRRRKLVKKRNMSLGGESNAVNGGSVDDDDDDDDDIDSADEEANQLFVNRAAVARKPAVQLFPEKATGVPPPPSSISSFSSSAVSRVEEAEEEEVSITSATVVAKNRLANGGLPSTPTIATTTTTTTTTSTSIAKNHTKFLAPTPKAKPTPPSPHQPILPQRLKTSSTTLTTTTTTTTKTARTPIGSSPAKPHLIIDEDDDVDDDDDDTEILFSSSMVRKKLQTQVAETISSVSVSGSASGESSNNSGSSNTGTPDVEIVLVKKRKREFVDVGGDGRSGRAGGRASVGGVGAGRSGSGRVSSEVVRID